VVAPIVEASDHGHTDGTSAYQEFIESCATDHVPLPEGILELMFIRQPNKSLLACERVYNHQNRERKQLVLAVHVVGNYLWQKDLSSRYGDPAPAPAETLKTLSALIAAEDWWPRLYVASLMLQYPELREAALMKSLQADSNKLVKSIVGRIGAGSKDAPVFGSGKPPADVGEPIGDPRNEPPGGPFKPR
jgi:hypothetical protein